MTRSSKRSASDRLQYRTAREKLKRETALSEREALRLETERPEEDDSPYFDFDTIDRPPSPDYELRTCLDLEKSFTHHSLVKDYIEGYEPFDNRMAIAVMEYSLRVIHKVMLDGPELWERLDCETELEAINTYLFNEATHIPVPGWATKRLVKAFQKWMDAPDWAPDMLAVLERYESRKWVA